LRQLLVDCPAQQMKEPVTSDVVCAGQNRATAQPRNRAIVQGVLLPKINIFPSLPTEAQRFFSLHQSLQDFHQPLHGLIRRLKKFLLAGQRVGQWGDVFSIPVAG